MSKTFLLNDFYKINTHTETNQIINTAITLSAEHPIFKGHFEQMPVVPGVCQTQIIKEVLQESVEKNLSLVKGDNIKFMGTIVPTKNPHIQIEINYKISENKYIVDAKLFHENTTFTKFKGEFIIS